MDSLSVINRPIFLGLLLFVGQVVYISMLKGEMSAKLAPMSFISPPKLSYEYGWSFGSMILSFLACEAAGTCAVYTYLSHHQYRYVCRQNLREGLSQTVDRWVIQIFIRVTLSHSPGMARW